MLKTEAVKFYLERVTHPDLAALYNANMEVQVNVAKDNGEACSGIYNGITWHGWTDGIQTWKSFRIPWNANSEEVKFYDSELKWDITEHCESIGMTGWDYVNRCSRWVAFDFDSIVGHKHDKKLTENELNEIREILLDVDWVTLRYSTSGKGLHLYVFLDCIPTRTHTEHAALARTVLAQLSGLTGYKFESKVDACGGNMWVWHRKMTGLQLIKQGKIYFGVPENWRENVCVIEGGRRKSSFQDISTKNNFLPLEDGHRKLINFLETNNWTWWWDADHNMLITHTRALLDAHSKLNFIGPYSTISSGDSKNDHNCFCFPLRLGSWVVRRYTKGTPETELWDTDSNGYTRCFYNCKPTLEIVARLYKACEHPNGGFLFKYAQDGLDALKLLDSPITLPNYILHRSLKIKEHKSESKIILEIPSESGDEPISGWINEKGYWRKVLPLLHILSLNIISESDNQLDEIVRHVITQNNEDYGWVLNSEGVWRVEPLQHIRVALQSMNYTNKEINMILGGGIFKAWTLVNKPFSPEYPGNREWNRDAPQLIIKPSNDNNLLPITWNNMLTHLGSNLTESIKNNEWCRHNNIYDGATYLKLWLASLIKEPESPLPYLFFYGPQNSGKSIFHESLLLLFTKGVVRADTALVSSFNAELENSIVCVVEETDLNKNRIANNKIKDWVTSPTIMIHRKQFTPYTVNNTTHWIQCSNTLDACPIFPGDTRITLINVPKLEHTIPKKEFRELLKKESSIFLKHLLQLELPSTDDRLNLPCINTSEKQTVEYTNKTELEIFIEDHCFYSPGDIVSFHDFYVKFIETLDPNEISRWSKIKVGKSIFPPFVKGRDPSNNSVIIGNISFTKTEPKNKICYLDNGKINWRSNDNSIRSQETGG